MEIQKPRLQRIPRSRRATLSATQATRELEELNRIGIALSETRDVGLLLDLILRKAREITAADAGSLYLVEQGLGTCEPHVASAPAAFQVDPERQRAISI